MRYVVIGSSAAGLFAVEEIRRHDPKGKITVLTADNEPYYSRCLTTYYLAGDIPYVNLFLRPDSFAPRLGLEIAYGLRVTGFNPEEQTVITHDGRGWEVRQIITGNRGIGQQIGCPWGGFAGSLYLKTHVRCQRDQCFNPFVQGSGGGRGRIGIP